MDDVGWISKVGEMFSNTLYAAPNYAVTSTDSQ